MDERVFLNVSRPKETCDLEGGGKLSPRYIGTFEVLRLVSKVAYDLALSPNLLVMYLVFHISMLKKYVLNGLHKLQHDVLDV